MLETRLECLLELDCSCCIKYQTTCCVPLTSTMRRSHSSLGRFATFLGACACVERDFDPPDVCCAVLPPLRVIAAALSPVPLRMAL
jgi:hypothetical protein